MSYLTEVKCLVDLTVEVLFQHIVSRLKLSLLKVAVEEPNTNDLLVDLGPAPAKKKKMESDVNKACFSRNQAVVETIRAQLDEYLVSSYSQVRWKLFQRFLTTYSNKEYKLFLSFASLRVKESKINKRLTESDQIKWTIDSPFNGQLNLVKLEGVTITSRKMMQAVTSLCPHLIEVKFSSDLQIAARDFFSVDELRSLLINSSSNCWGNVNRVAFGNVPAVYRQTFLAILGNQLHSLAFPSFSLLIDVVAELLPCNRLQELSIYSKCTLLPPASTGFPPADNFLPQLRKLTSLSCLGVWSPHFERERPLLMTLKLACPHIGIVSKSKLKWRDVPDLWPAIRELHFHDAKGFTVETLLEIVPQLNDLKVMGFPKSVLSSDEEKRLVKDFAVKLRNLKEPITLQICTSQTVVHH